MIAPTAHALTMLEPCCQHWLAFHQTQEASIVKFTLEDDHARSWEIMVADKSVVQRGTQREYDEAIKGLAGHVHSVLDTSDQHPGHPSLQSR